ncbi:tetratricopeptide repeat protein [Tahibacter amnicola]|uniref:Tetratricopeptide repeat protein n=1 Tax=Tahibacter amnicola TaxID=2976241 RepID=A0ABY6BAG1_9GAMM|nr:tetratricopeptide repeat protein [Tahibacter amnicola]UXI66854.1 tetratricopeptide repeat protein [Tahibacter amnicola]
MSESLKELDDIAAKWRGGKAPSSQLRLRMASAMSLAADTPERRRTTREHLQAGILQADQDGKSSPTLVMTAHLNLAQLAMADGDLPTAQRLFALAQTRCDQLGSTCGEVQAAIGRGLAMVLRDQGRHAEAAPVYEHTLAFVRSRFNATHPWITSLLVSYGMNAYLAGDYTHAESLLTQAIQSQDRSNDAGRHASLLSYHTLALIGLERYDEAEAEIRETLKESAPLGNEVMIWEVAMSHAAQAYINCIRHPQARWLGTLDEQLATLGKDKQIWQPRLGIVRGWIQRCSSLVPAGNAHP